MGREIIGIAATLTEQLPPSGGQSFTLSQKVFWLELAEELGPQRVEELKNAAQFMSAVSEY
jgi:hypothetical protein